MGKRKKSLKINWKQLAMELGLLTHCGESGGTDSSRIALEKILGTQFIKDTVDYSLTFGRVLL